MRAMRSALKSKQESTTPSPEQAPAPPAPMWYHGQGPEAVMMDTKLFAEHGHREAKQPCLDRLPDEQGQHGKGQHGKDVIDRGLLSMATARQLFETYHNEHFRHYPTVVIPTSTTADELRRTKPTLFLAVIAAASGKENSDLAVILDNEVLHTYATRTLMQSEKSLELIQALLISAVWYHPPAKFGQLKYYEYIHMATTMSMDIGIGSRPKHHRSRLNNASRGREPAKPAMIHPAEDASNPDLSMTPRSRDNSPDTGSLECRRTFLACYMICAGVSLSLRRPNMLRVNSYVRECVEYIKRSPDAISTDRTLTNWTELVILGEEICTSLAFDDPGGVASIAELRTQLMLKDFEKRLTAWYTSQPDTENNGSLIIMYWTVRLYLHEVALHVDHSPEDFKAPYQMGVVHPHDGIDIPTQALAGAVAECITCAHALLNTFLGMDVDSLRALPVFSYVRVSFAAFVLAKLSLSAVHHGSRIGQVLDRSSLKVEGIMDKIILHVRNVVGEHRCRVPAIFLALLFKLRQWCLNPEMIDRSESGRAAMMEAAQEQEAARNTPSTAPARSTMAIEGPRVVEQSPSSRETTPETQAGGQQMAFESVADPMAGSASYHTTSSMTHESSSNLAYCMTSVAGNNATGDYLPVGTEQIQLDGDMMQYFNNMPDFPEGGLTGLDDWMPADLLGFTQMPDITNWQTMPNTNGSSTF